MKKAVLVIATLLIGLVDKQVYANTVRSNGIYDNFDNWAGAKAHNWSSSTSYSELSIVNEVGYLIDNTNASGGAANYQIIDDIQLDISNVGSNGVSIVYSSSESYITYTYYAFTLYYCTTNSVSLTLSNMYVGTSWTPYNTEVNKNALSNTSLQYGLFNDANFNAINNCRALSGYFWNTESHGNVIAFKLTSSSTTGNVHFMGFKTEPLKATNYVTQSILNQSLQNAGFATASSVSEVQSSVNQVQQELNGVNDSINETNDILTEDHDYNSNASETIEGQDDMNDMSEAEEDLMGELDFSGAQDLEITINPHASQYIWLIVERLRTLPGVTILMTSILGLGIIKMILNR